LLAFKFNEPMTGAQYKEKLEALLNFFDTEYQVPKADVFRAELGALVHINFALNVPYLHVLEQFKRSHC